MSQTFEYPNLLTGSRSGIGWTYDSGSFYKPLLNHDLHNSTKNENYIQSPLFILKHGITYAFSALTANTANCMSAEIWILYEKVGVDGWIGGVIRSVGKGPGGGWVTHTFSLPSTSPEGHYYLRFDNNGSTDGKDALIWFNSPMLCIAEEPHAWAPAEGEVWPE